MSSAIAAGESNPRSAATLRGWLEMEEVKFKPALRRQRRALGVINQNIAASRPLRQSGCDKISDLNRRPVTRKSGQQIGDSQQQLVPSEPMTVCIDERIEKPEEMEEEIEMEDVNDDLLVMNIDRGDAKDPLAVVDYVEDIYSYYRTMEYKTCESSEYMLRQDDINDKMRAILIDWLIEVHDKFELMSETLFLTVNLIDRFLSKQSVIRKKLQLVGLVSLLLACKYEEVSVPAVSDLILISDKAYARREIIEMEKLMLNKLQFNVSLPTPYVFLRRFLKAAQAEKTLEEMSFYLMELCVVEYEMVKFPPSLLASSAIYTAQVTLYGFAQWTKTCESHTRYSEDELQECSKRMSRFHQNAAKGKLTAVYRKYCTEKYGYVAKCEAAAKTHLEV